MEDPYFKEKLCFFQLLILSVFFNFFFLWISGLQTFFLHELQNDKNLTTVIDLSSVNPLS